MKDYLKIKMRILITGASGSGTTTLAQALSQELQWNFIDVDDYFWLPTNPKYQLKRDKISRVKMITDQLNTHNNSVVSGSIMNWGKELENSFDLIIFLYLDTKIRIKRLKDREEKRLGHAADPVFIKWASEYDSGPLKGRSLKLHKKWLLERSCQIFKIEENISLQEKVNRIINEIKLIHDNQNNGYIFKSERLGFRKWKDADIELFAELNSDDNVMEFFPNKLTFQETQKFVEKIQDHFKKYNYGLYAVDILEKNEFIGYIGFANPTFEAYFMPCVEIGWRLKYNAWNKGYATEGAKRCIQYAFKNLNLPEIYSFTAHVNIRSEKVMKKIGMEKIGEFDHPNIIDGHILKPHVLYKI